MAADESPTEAKAALAAGMAHASAGRWAEAADCYDAACAGLPDYPGLAGARLHARMKLCDWRDFGAQVTGIAAGIQAGKTPAVPFDLIALPVTAAQQRRNAETYTAGRFGAAIAEPPRPARGDRIHIGYFSSDLWEHATAFLIAELFELHDRDRFELTAFSWGGTDDPMRERLRGSFDRFYDVSRLPDATVVDLARGLGLHIAVDLKGYTTFERSGIFAARAAPVQVSYLGFPSTMGASFMDYLVADPQLIGPDETQHYAEQIAWLPDCYQPNDRRRAMAESTERAAHGLPADAIVFAAMNATYKTTPAAFAAWMDVLKAVPGSVLWWLAGVPGAADNLRAEAARAGVDPARLIAAPFRPAAAHLERLRHADLFLDTWPCSAHTTASDALWAGLPLLTLRGETFAGRVAASLLAACGLDELVAHDPREYVARAVRLAQDPPHLDAVRRRAAGERSTSPVFNTPRYARALEALYVRMDETWAAGRPPGHLNV
jgi:predicted O-linked N-acetylglucosamine transferase (SPINDLY family)